MISLKLLVTSTALSLCLALPVVAQQSGQDSTQQPAPSTDSKGMSGTSDAAKDKVEQMTKGSGGLSPVTEQKSTQFLADNLIGSSVYNDGDESIGKVEDLALSEDGTVEAVVVSVGGFLGVGSKEVGLPWDSVKRELVDGEMKLMVSATTDELKQMPEFRTAAEIKSEQEAERARQSTMPATGGGAGTGTGTGTTTQ
jgi:sporulation protein YlmC with PRC-barrel domain